MWLWELPHALVSTTAKIDSLPWGRIDMSTLIHLHGTCRTRLATDIAFGGKWCKGGRMTVIVREPGGHPAGDVPGPLLPLSPESYAYYRIDLDCFVHQVCYSADCIQTSAFPAGRRRAAWMASFLVRGSPRLDYFQ